MPDAACEGRARSSGGANPQDREALRTDGRSAPAADRQRLPGRAGKICRPDGNVLNESLTGTGEDDAATGPRFRARQSCVQDTGEIPMKIEGSNPLRTGPVKKTRSGKAATGDGFTAALSDSDEGVAAGTGVTGQAPVGSLDAILAAQAADDPLSGQRRAEARGEEILDRLDVLRTDILLGRVPQARLEELSVLAKSGRDSVEDPRLEAVLDEIDLRVQVELAKLSVTG